MALILYLKFEEGYPQAHFVDLYSIRWIPLGP